MKEINQMINKQPIPQLHNVTLLLLMILLTPLYILSQNHKGRALMKALGNKI